VIAFLDRFAEFRKPSWAGWKRHLARLTPDVRELFAICGRGAGKSRIAAVLACFFATQRTYDVVPGERIYIAVIAPDRRQAGVTHRYIIGLLKSDRTLADLVDSESGDSVELKNFVTIEVVTASVTAPRGRAYALVIIEEAAFLPTDQSVNPDTEIIRAVRPALARVPGSLLAVVSSPYAKRGVLYEAWKKNQEHPDPRVLVIQAATLELNPTFDALAVERALEEDPDSARAEYLAEFRTDVESLFRIEAIDAVTPKGIFELSRGAFEYVRAFVDPSGGSSDSFTLGIAGQDPKTNLATLLCTREWKPPFSPSEVVEEAVDVLRSYELREVTGDAYSGEFVRELFKQNGVQYILSAKNRSGIYLDGLAMINSGRCALLDDPKLRNQLLGLERRVGRTSDTIDHRTGAHDDVANAAMGALVAGPTDDGDDLGYTW
jgi:hypothetical protein